MPLTVDHPETGPYRSVVTIAEPRPTHTLDDELTEALDRCDQGSVQLWVHNVDDQVDETVRRLGFTSYRDLWQLRCPLPLPISDQPAITTRAFTAADSQDFLEVNRRAFAWHPEQGALSADDLAARQREPWFDPDGFRLLHDGEELIGFCWTKIHTNPPLGEIYAIAVDPSRHGQGLGGPLTRAGLDWLAEHGLDTGMLYVESDNHAANAVYTALGFVHHQTNRAYVLDRP